VCVCVSPLLYICARVRTEVNEEKDNLTCDAKEIEDEPQC